MRTVARLAALLSVAALLLGALADAPAAPAASPAYAPREIVVRYFEKNAPRARARTRAASIFGESPTARAARVIAAADAAARDRRVARALGLEGESAIASHTRLLRLVPGADLAVALARLRSEPDVEWAVPDYRAHLAIAPPTPATTGAPAVPSGPGAPGGPTVPTGPAAPTGFPIPDDPGLPGGPPGGWEALQWNFVGLFGVNALQAWANLDADHAPGGRGVIVAVLDTGMAYANHGRFRRSPDLSAASFVRGYDFVAGNPHPDDHNGHGTHVASTIVEATNNGRGLTGLAYGVRVMPVRVLDREGDGDASVIARGVRYAVNHGARVINLSLEFPAEITAKDIPELVEALRYANHRGVLVVAAAGNESSENVDYPARLPHVIAVGASTEHGCLASYSNYGPRLSLVAPGGGADANLAGDPNCNPEAPRARYSEIYQVTFLGSSPRRFGIPLDYEGTSMACPHVAATAALIIASGLLGPHPTPAHLTARLLATARPLGGPGDRRDYGAGLLDAGAATSPGGPGLG